MHPHCSYAIVREVGDVHIFEITRASLNDAEFLENLRVEIVEIVNRIESPRIVINLHRVEYISSLAIGMFLAIKKAVGERGGRFAVSDVSAQVQQVFDLARFEQCVRLESSEEDAVRYVAE